MNAPVVSEGRVKLDQAREILGKLNRLRDTEPGYLSAALIPNTGNDPRFSKQDFPNFVWFLESNDSTRSAASLRKLPTRMDNEALEAFRKGDVAEGIMGFVPTTKGIKMLGHLAHSFMHRGMPILEGGTSLGKTYVIRALTKLMYGNKAQPLHFYCDGQTDTTELLAKYIPNSHDSGALKVHEFLQSEKGKTWVTEQTESGRLNAETGVDRIIFDAANHIGKKLNKNSFTLSHGAIPRAAMASVDNNGQVVFDPEKSGPGCVLIIDEVSAAKGSVVLALLRLRGDGEMVNSLQLWEDGGRTIPFGPNCFIAFATNTLKYANRNPVDEALARSLNWERMGELEKEDIKELVTLITTHDYGHRSAVNSDTHFLDITKHSELYRAIGEAVLAAHEVVSLIANTSQAGGDRQKIPCTFEDVLKSLKYCNTSQILGDPDVDLYETVLEAIRTQYFSRIASADNRATQFQTFKSSCESDRSISAITVGGKVSSIAEAIRRETISAWQQDNPEITIADPEILKMLAEQRKTEDQKALVESVIEGFSKLAAEDLIKFIKIAKSTFTQEARESFYERLESEDTLPKGIATAAEWSEKRGLRSILLGILKD